MHFAIISCFDPVYKKITKDRYLAMFFEVLTFHLISLELIQGKKTKYVLFDRNINTCLLIEIQLCFKYLKIN